MTEREEVEQAMDASDPQRTVPGDPMLEATLVGLQRGSCRVEN
jgi:hypothetical protein